jgi:hypothetical protein
MYMVEIDLVTVEFNTFILQIIELKILKFKITIH